MNQNVMNWRNQKGMPEIEKLLLILMAKDMLASVITQPLSLSVEQQRRMVKIFLSMLKFLLE